MKSLLLRCSALFLGCFAGACSSSHGYLSGDSGSSSDAHGSSGGAELAVDSVAAYTSYGSYQAKHGKLVVVSVTLSNDGAAHPLATNPLYFSLSLPDHTLVAASPATSMLDHPCDASVAVDSSGHATCNVMFDVDASAAPNAIVYADPSGPSASASIGTLPAAGPPDDATWGGISQSDRATLCSSIKPTLGPCGGDPMLMVANMDICSTPKPDSLWPVEQEDTVFQMCRLAIIDVKATIADVKACIAATNAQVCAGFTNASCEKILSWTVSGNC